jgi:APA family basic amino acid/polyamine antiporter
MSAELRRSLTLYGLVMIAVGSTIGSGIFRTPGQIAAHVHLPEYVIALWVIGGVAALTGALTFAEMGSMFPGAGGLYVYLREAYGDTMGFLYGWFILFISTSGSIAALSAVCSEHLLYLFGAGADSSWKLPLALAIIVFLTVVNLFGVKIGEWIANLFTGAKLLGLALIIVAGLFFAGQEATAANAASDFANTPPTNLWSAFALGIVGVLFSIGGWHHASYVAGEAQNPQRNVPRAMMLGASIVTLVYVLANIAYLRLLPVEQIANSKTVAADAMNTLFSWGGILMAFLIAFSAFGTIGIYCMSAPRIYFAMAKDGIFFRKLAEVHPRWQTPMNAILAQSGWSVFLLLFWGTFENLIEYVTFMDWVGLMLVGTTIFVFRKKRPDAQRGYRTIFYPLTPLIFIGISAWFIIFTLIENPVRAVAGLFVAAAGLAAYWFCFRKKQGLSSGIC